MAAETAGPQAAVFFDVDGTLVRSTIVNYYVYFRTRRMPPVARELWFAAYLLKCLYYLAVDRVDRTRFNVMFYRDYAGLNAATVKGLAGDCLHDVVHPRMYAEACECLREHRRLGHRPVLVTGSLDFIMRPLAAELGVSDLVAAALVEQAGAFTGELDGPPLSEKEKGRRVREFAEAHCIDLAQSHAYGDSVADLPMLETVGFPHAVNPDKSLKSLALARHWPVHHWTRLIGREGRSA